MLRKRLLYTGEAAAILMLAPLALYPSLLTVLVLVSLPALVLAVVGAIRPSYFEPGDLTDPRAGRRRYVHVSAGLCALGLAWAIIWLTFVG